MKGSNTQLLRFMEGASKRFVIPVYQRNYDWKKEQCRQLYDDLVKVIRDGRRTHFFGSIVSAYQTSGVHIEYLVIDGQQRLTTVSLLMLAIHDLLTHKEVSSGSPYLADKLYEEYLVDKYESQETRIKLKPTKNNRSAFQKLFDEDSEKDETSNLTCNYQYFCERILKQEITADELYEAIGRLEIINIELDHDDNPQMIFESLNSTGLALSEADKIRNYILMNVSSMGDQEKYYEKYWNPIEINTQYNVSLFARDYLSIKQQEIPPMNRIYPAFKKYVEDEKPGTEELLKDLLDYSERYSTLLKGNTADRQLNACIERLNRLEYVVTRPFFLEVLHLKDIGDITLEQVKDIFLITENYLFRRFICDLPTSSLNKIFLFLHREIIRYDGATVNYTEKFKYALLAKTEKNRFPQDAEFVEALSTKQIYNFNQKNKIYILERFENYGTREDKDIYRHVDDDTYSIEHVMPQHLNAEWIEALGPDFEEIHETWVHRLANLTLTAYNSRYSNSSFLKKRDMPNGFSESGLRLNTWISKQSKWTLEELQARNEHLMGQAQTIWSYPISSYKPESAQMDEYSLADDVDLRGRDIERFQFHGTEETVDSWINMMQRVLLILHAEDSSVLPKLAASHDKENDLTRYISDKREDIRHPLDLAPGLYLDRNTNTTAKISMLRKFFKEFNADPDDLQFYLKSDSDEVIMTPKEQKYFDFWTLTLPQIQNKMEGKSFSNCNPVRYQWIFGSFGIGDFSIECYVNDNSASVMMRFASFKEKNKSAYDCLLAHKDEIESKVNASLLWERCDDGKYSYISLRIDSGLLNREKWDIIAEFMAVNSKLFYDAMVPLLIEWNTK